MNSKDAECATGSEAYRRMVDHYRDKEELAARLSTKDESPTTVKFNVGGRIYEVSKSLLEGFPNTMLSEKASSSSSSPVFFDRDPDRFAYCLDYMRGKVYLPETASKLAFLEELKFFGFEDIDETKILSDEKSQQNCMTRFDQITEATRKRIAQMEKEAKATRQRIVDLELDLKRRKEEIKLEKLALRCRATSVESIEDRFHVDYGDVEGLSNVHKNQYFIECCDNLALDVDGNGASGTWNTTQVFLRRKTNSEGQK